MRKAFTFLEIVMTMIVMTAGLIPLMQLVPGALEHTRRLTRLTQAGFLAQEKADALRHETFDANYDFTATANETGNFNASDSSLASYKYEVTDSTTTSAQDVSIKELNVVVWFDEDDDDNPDSGEASAELDTKICERD